MSIRIEERFQVRAPVDQVWTYLADPHRVVACLPGAELTGEESEGVFLGRVKVKVGPIVAAYAGKASIVERDDATRMVRIVGEGKEAGGGGSARMTMTSTVTAAADGVSDVHITADIDLVGKIVQFGRGM